MKACLLTWYIESNSGFAMMKTSFVSQLCLVWHILYCIYLNDHKNDKKKRIY
jgi:hypothetical protein